MPEQPIVFDFTKQKVFRAAESDPEMLRDLLRALREVGAIRRRIRLTVGGTPPPNPTA
jgi:hypothetical protein